MVTAGWVRSARCVFASVHARDDFGKGCLRREFVRVCVQGGAVGWVLMLRSGCGVRAVCDGLERWCGVQCL